jgi:thiol-disulfide isomerase/thioredoxin
MSDRAKTWLAAVFVLGALGLLLYSVRSVKDDSDTALALQTPAQAQPAADFTLPDAATGQPVHLQSETNTHPVVLDFWATWCGPCRAELPHLSALAHKYQGRVAFYGVNSSDRPAAITAFAGQNSMAFPTLADPQHGVAAKYGADALPTLVVIDRQGRARVFTQGYDPGADLEGSLSKDLDTLLAGK